MVLDRFSVSAVLLLSLVMFGCGEGELSIDYPDVRPENTATIASALTAENRRARATMIRDAAQERGLTNGVLLAGIADVETNLAHCWSEATWACKGPASSSCNGGPVIAGSADGPCSHRQGGLGMFQFDAGTYNDTLAREGRRILTIGGNTQAAVDFVIHRVKISDFISGVSTNQQALAWMNEVRPETTQWDQWIRTVTGYYNGCFEGQCSVFHERYHNYDNKTRAILDEFGHDFWYGSSGGTGGGVSTGGGGQSDPGSGGSTTQPVRGVPSVASQLNPIGASVPQGGSIALNWQSVDATRYMVRMEYYADAEWRHYYEWERTRSVFEVWPQVPDTSYRWTVRACNAQGCADWSEYAYFEYGTIASSNEPTDDTSDNTSTDDTTDDTSADDTTDNTSTDDTSSVADDSTTDDTNQSSPPTVSLPDDGRPGLPASMRPAGVRIDTQDVPLTWSEPADAMHYDIIMYRHDGTDWVRYYVWENKTGGSFTVWPVVDETYYTWAIRACNMQGCSDWSDFHQFYFAGL